MSNIANYTSVVWKVKHVGQKLVGIDSRLSRSNGGEFDHFGILQHDELDRIVRTPEACPRAGYVLKYGSVPWSVADGAEIVGWREALLNEMNLKDSEAYHRPTGSKYLVVSSSAPYCNRQYPTHMVVMDARTQQVLFDQFFSVPICVRLASMSERSYDLLTKIIRAVPKRSEGKLQDIVGEDFMRLSEGNV